MTTQERADFRQQQVSARLDSWLSGHAFSKQQSLEVVNDRDACVQMYYLLGEKLGFDAVK